MKFQSKGMQEVNSWQTWSNDVLDSSEHEKKMISYIEEIILDESMVLGDSKKIFLGGHAEGAMMVKKVMQNTEVTLGGFACFMIQPWKYNY